MTLTSIWRSTLGRQPRIDQVRFYDRQADLPAELGPHELAIVGTTEHPKWAVFECPCAQRHRIMLNLQRNRSPYWKLQIDEGGPSLHPSVDVVETLRCHFWLKRGRVRWSPNRRNGRRVRAFAEDHAH